MSGDGETSGETGTSADSADSADSPDSNDSSDSPDSEAQAAAGNGGETDADTDESESAQLPEGLRVRGEVVGVERVPATAVPQSFPVAIGTDEALALHLAFPRHDGQVSTYFSLPGDDPDERLANLLAVHGVDAVDQLEGVGVLVDIVDGHPVPVSIDESRRGDARAVYGVVAGLAPSIAIALFSFFGLGELLVSPVYAGLYLVGTFLVLPVSIYVDAWYLRTTTDWGGRPLRWALLSVVPPLYVVVAPYYLIARENARPLSVETARPVNR